MLPILLAAVAAITPVPLNANDHILAAQPARNAVGKSALPPLPGQWTPTSVEAATVKAALCVWLTSAHPTPLPFPSFRSGPVDPAAYVFQYVGVHMNPDLSGPKVASHRMIIVHAVQAQSAPAGYDLDNVQLIVNDGGGTYFDAVYDLDRRKLMHFGFHGYG